MLRLFSYFRSSCAYRVRIALYHKGLVWETIPIHLLKGQQRSEEYLRNNPSAMVPALLLENEKVLTQSLAILEYLEEDFPEKALLPKNFQDRAIVRAMAQIISVDVQPLQNLRVTRYLKEEIKASEEQVNLWLKTFISEGMSAFEVFLQRHAGTYCFGDQITMADVCLAPQILSTRRFGVDLAQWPKISEVSQRLEAIEAFVKAHPKNQPDFSE
ncbi:MAG: maleylacetoacetate isomerase [Candidatus Cloacimonetes bacterium]|nr:maleylacetoacetate isomerase [Candidatus Cloacimonadota bacterium]